MIDKYEKATTNPTLKTVEKLAEALGIEPYQLLK
jgi:transcriptional regulator with XRE-family HTH domain